MRRILTITAVGLAGCALALAAAAPAFATHEAFDKNEQKCRKIVAKHLGKLVKTADKAIAACHKDQQKGNTAATADCNDLSDPSVDLKDKFGTAVTKGSAKVVKLCAGLDTDVLDEYRSCPIDPCTGVNNNPMINFSEVAACMACVARSSTEARSSALLGNSAPGGSVLQGDDAKCHQAIAKGYGKVVNTIDKDRTKCQKDADKIGESNVNLHCNITERNCTTNADCQPFLVGDTCGGCIGSDAKLKIQGAIDKAEAGFDKKCLSLGDTTGLLPCGSSDPVATKACLRGVAEDHGDEIVVASYELEPTVCPIGLTSTFLAGAGTTAGKFCTSDAGTPPCISDSDCASGVCEQIAIRSRTSLEVGHNGLGHAGDLPDRYQVNVGLDCSPNTNTPCGDCAITGVDTTVATSAYNRRCQEDHTIPCTAAIGAFDGACPGLGICSYYLSGPVNFNAANTPTCVLNRIDQDITGTANPDSGAGAQSLKLRSLVFLGLGQNQPCAICTGVCIAGKPSTVACLKDSDCDQLNPGDGVCDLEADTANDGVADGRCIGGPDAGTPCDVNNYDATFGPTSLDCGLPPGNNFSGLGLQINLALTTQSQSMPFGVECENPFFSPCACAVCTGNQSVACNSNAECALIGAGDCNSKGGGNSADRFPNACDTDAFVCTDTGADGGGFKGECDTKEDTYCDGYLRANGEAFLTCATNSDCETLDSICPGGDCGNCLATVPRRCFLDPIQATGVADPDDPVLVGNFCVPPTTTNSINVAVGLPGPARVKIDLLTELKY